MMPIITLLLILLGFGMVPSMAQQHRVWVDTDLSSGRPVGDMDDALALLMLLRDTSVHIEGISVVHGVRHARRVTAKLLRWYAPARDTPIHRGADTQRELGQRTEAVNAMIRALEKGPMTVLALGPATNVATVLTLRPDLVPQMQKVGFCGGRWANMVFAPDGGKVRFSDYNFEHDSVAARLLLQSGVPLLLAGYDCSDGFFLHRALYRPLKGSSHARDRWMYRNLSRWEWVWQHVFGVKDGFIPFDCSTVGALLHPDEFCIRADRAATVTEGPNDARSIVKTDRKMFLTVGAQGGIHRVDHCYHTHGIFRERLLNALLRDLSTDP
ncbi:MAG: nucleoside hydrolase [Flavobacteriales bacterium]|nr:nucleoside hydrolase [Flavobacteriales bacterium]